MTRLKMNTIFIIIIAILLSSFTIGYSALSSSIKITGNLTYNHNVKAENLSYDNTNTGVNCDTAQCMIDCLVNKNTCFASKFQVGDYFTMIPSKSNYEITTQITGYTSVQTIAPNELTLWRVIRVNGNGSVDAVSEYTSSAIVNFRGTKGYANFVETLETIAAQYAKNGYTEATRMIGYDGQTKTIMDTSTFDGSVNAFASQTSTPLPTTGTGQEYSGGSLGDTLYLKDYQLVNDIYGTLDAKKVGTNTSTSYWLASRRYYITSTGTASGYCGRSINSGGSLSSYYYLRYYTSNGWSDETRGFAVRPIITLKSTVTKSGGQGTLASPYTLS